VSNTTTAESVGAFTRDQVEILSTRKVEPEWLREQRFRAHETFSNLPTPDTTGEEWRYTDIGSMLRLDEIGMSEDSATISAMSELPSGLRALVSGAGESSAQLMQVDASVVYRDLPAELARQGVIFTSLDLAIRDHGELVRKHLGTAIGEEDGKYAALNTALWSGGTFLYIPENVKVEVPLRAFRWMAAEGASMFGRTLIVADRFAEVALVEELGSDDAEGQALSNGATEIVAGEGAKVTYVTLQRYGKGVVHLTTDRLVAGRDATITTVYTTIGSDVTRADIKCRMQAPGAHVDMLGLYIAEGEQHFDHETLQDHVAPHASSNLLFKGAITDRSRSVFRGLIRVHPNAQRTDAYQTNRNLILSSEARADSLPNLEIAADDVRCSHAATIGQLDVEEIFYLQSRGLPRMEAMRLVIFGFFGEVLDQLKLEDVRKELVRAVERKLYATQA
jgi:Fe-S cluster assembly protein SufD